MRFRSAAAVLTVLTVSLFFPASVQAGTIYTDQQLVLRVRRFRAADLLTITPYATHRFVSLDDLYVGAGGGSRSCARA